MDIDNFLKFMTEHINTFICIFYLIFRTEFNCSTIFSKVYRLDKTGRQIFPKNTFLASDIRI